MAHRFIGFLLLAGALLCMGQERHGRNVKHQDGSGSNDSKLPNSAFVGSDAPGVPTGPLPSDNSFQPKVITVERNPARKVFGSLSMPGGSPWCFGKPTYWLVGHQPTDEKPWCWNETSESWHLTEGSAVLDTTDSKNDLDGPQYIDRHDCVFMDVNGDTFPDILCSVGANSGKGHGFNEVYLTLPDGGLVKILENGLQKYTTMRNRLMATLRGADGAQLVFLATKGIRRDDGATNVHRMFRHNGTTAPFFEEVERGPWTRYSEASCLVVADLNQDGFDDLIVCNKYKRAYGYIQNEDSSWTKIKFSGKKSKKWRGARIADITGDGIADLIVVGWGKSPSYIRIFEGSGKPPFFDFNSRPYYRKELPFATPDMEVLDVNGDGILDIYVIQTDEGTEGSYCTSPLDKKFWWGGGVQPPASFIPPNDEARDLLLIGNDIGEDGLFTVVEMNHTEPGCGFLLEPFGERALLLAQGTNSHPGHNLLLQW